VTICRTFLATVGTLTPRHGWKNTACPFSAVVKIALRIVTQYPIEDGLTSWRSRSVMNSLMSSGMISISRMSLNHGMTHRSR
jgi:hypothetical protein